QQQTPPACAAGGGTGGSVKGLGGEGEVGACKPRCLGVEKIERAAAPRFKIRPEPVTCRHGAGAVVTRAGVRGLRIFPRRPDGSLLVVIFAQESRTHPIRDRETPFMSGLIFNRDTRRRRLVKLKMTFELIDKKWPHLQPRLPDGLSQHNADQILRLSTE